MQFDIGSAQFCPSVIGRSRLALASEQGRALLLGPYERADVVSDQYDQWRIEDAYLIGEVTFHAAAFLDMFKEYPPSQRPASFSIDQVRRNVDKVIEKSFQERGLE
jgi:hypothetical protein